MWWGDPMISVPSGLVPDTPLLGCEGYDALAEINVASVRFYVPPYMGGAEGFEIMGRMPALEVVQLPTAGFDHALNHLPEGVVMCNAGGVHDASTAELAVGLIIARLRRIDDMARAMPRGQWIADRYDALADRRVVIVGAGGVGRAIAARLEPFEVEIALVARTTRDGVHSLDELPRVLPEADVVILAVPLDEMTQGMVDAEFLGRMRDGALLVNVARGGVVRTDDLLVEVASGRLQAALDVTDPEPLPTEHPLWTMPGVLISPHVGGNTTAFAPRMRRLITEQVARWRAGESLHHVIRS